MPPLTRVRLAALALILCCHQQAPPTPAYPAQISFRFRVQNADTAYNAGVCACVAIACAPEANANPIFLSGYRTSHALMGGSIDIDRPAQCRDRALRVEVHYEVSDVARCAGRNQVAVRTIPAAQRSVDLLTFCSDPARIPIIARPPEAGFPDGVTGPCTFEELPACNRPEFFL